MSYRDQQKYIEALKKYERKMSPKEAEELKMFLKRQKDDEDFDSVSFKRLKELYDKYNAPVDKSKYDSFLKRKKNKRGSSTYPNLESLLYLFRKIQ